MRVARRPFEITSLGFWRAYLVTMRPYLLFVSGATGLLGLAMAPDVSSARLWATFSVFFLSYGVGQALTDVFQTDCDAISAPYRPLVRGEITKKQVLGVSAAASLFITVVLAVLSLWTFLLCVAGWTGLATYSWAKRKWWAGPAWNSAVVALIPPAALLATGVALGKALGNPLVLPGTTSVFFSYAVFVILGYFKDVSADRATGYVTLPVRFGRGVSVVVSAVCAAASVMASAWMLARGGGLRAPDGALRAVGLVAWVVGALSLLGAHVVIRKVASDEEAHPGIALSVRGYVYMHFGACAALRPELGPLVLLMVALFEVALATRPSASQI